MLGLPWETFLIMAGGILLWIVYTLVFFFKTKNWTIEDADYDGTGDSDADRAESVEGDQR